MYKDIYERGAADAERKAKMNKPSPLGARPSATHMALVQMQKIGLVKAILSGNTDGLHLKSGFPRNAIAEIHGNMTKEICWSKKCRGVVFRDYSTRGVATTHTQHVTGRLCPRCGDKMVDTITNFGETPSAEEQNKMHELQKDGDLCIVMGSSLTVDRETPSKIALRGNVCIINLQPTPLDNIATGPKQDGAPLRINGLVDDVMGRLAKSLGFTIPEWNLTRYAKITWKPADDETPDAASAPAFILNGLAPDLETPYTLWKTVRCVHGKKVQEPSSATAATNYEFTVPVGKTPELVLTPYGHYKEPVLKFEAEPGRNMFLRMTLIDSGKWEIVSGSKEEIMAGKGTQIMTSSVPVAPEKKRPWVVGEGVTMGELTAQISRVTETSVYLTFTDWGKLEQKFPKSTKLKMRMADTMLKRVEEPTDETPDDVVET